MPDVVIDGKRVACTTAQLREMDDLAAKAAGKAREDFAAKVLNPAAPKKAAKKKKG